MLLYRCGKRRQLVGTGEGDIDGGGFCVTLLPRCFSSTWKRGSEATVQYEYPIKAKLHDGNVGEMQHIGQVVGIYGILSDPPVNIM